MFENSFPQFARLNSRHILQKAFFKHTLTFVRFEFFTNCNGCVALTESGRGTDSMYGYLFDICFRMENVGIFEEIKKIKKISKKGLHFPEDYYIIPIVANEVAKTK